MSSGQEFGVTENACIHAGHCFDAPKRSSAHSTEKREEREEQSARFTDGGDRDETRTAEDVWG